MGLRRQHMLLDLVQEDDGVADDHAAQGQDAQVGDEARDFPKRSIPQETPMSPIGAVIKAKNMRRDCGAGT